MEIRHTSSGFEIIEFTDYYGEWCSLQQTGSGAIWLGQGEERIHLDVCMVKELVSHLQAWIEAGSFEIPANKFLNTDKVGRSAPKPCQLCGGWMDSNGVAHY